MNTAVLGDISVEFDPCQVRLVGQRTAIFTAESGTEITKAETNGKDRVFVLVRGTECQSKTNVLALDAEGKVAWRAKSNPGTHDDELVDFKYSEPLLQAWSWNYVYEFEGRSGELVRKEANK